MCFYSLFHLIESFRGLGGVRCYAQVIDQLVHLINLIGFYVDIYFAYFSDQMTIDNGCLLNVSRDTSRDRVQFYSRYLVL